ARRHQRSREGDTRDGPSTGADSCGRASRAREARVRADAGWRRGRNERPGTTAAGWCDVGQRSPTRCARSIERRREVAPGARRGGARERGARADLIVSTLAQEFGGRGGGKAALAQGGVPGADVFPALLARAAAIVAEQTG